MSIALWGICLDEKKARSWDNKRMNGTSDEFFVIEFYKYFIIYIVIHDITITTEVKLIISSQLFPSFRSQSLTCIYDRP